MIHLPCGALNEKSPCMAKGRCKKQYPRLLVPNTITSNDGYPQYRRRYTEDGGKTTIIKKHNGTTIEVDDHWVLPYSPLLSKTFNAHIRGSGAIIMRFAKKFETLWEHINLACGRFQANIIYNT